MRRFSDRHTLTTLSELNVTPLLDLAFVLLIIFMITTPLMERSSDLILPSSQAAPGAPPPDAVHVLGINREEILTLDGQELSAAELAPHLAALAASTPGLAVVVRSHRDLPVQKLVDVMDLLQQARITRVGVVTNPEP